MKLGSSEAEGLDEEAIVRIASSSSYIRYGVSMLLCRQMSGRHDGEADKRLSIVLEAEALVCALFHLDPVSLVRSVAGGVKTQVNDAMIVRARHEVA